jgi:tRNA(fMet)-specific endonuclease VapC
VNKKIKLNKTLYMLDTNIASHVIKNDIPVVRQRLLSVPMNSVTVSAITKAELLFGLAKRNYPKGLATRIHEFLIRVEVLPWDEQVSEVYADLRALCETSGVTLSPLDLMIAAHAKAINAILITRDKAFSRIPDGLILEDWAS